MHLKHSIPLFVTFSLFAGSIPCRGQSDDCRWIDGNTFTEVISGGQETIAFLESTHSFSLQEGEELTTTLSVQGSIPLPPEYIGVPGNNCEFAAQCEGTQAGPLSELVWVITNLERPGDVMTPAVIEVTFACGLSLLPTELISLVVVGNGDEANLYWQTASETNSRGFEVQRRGVDRKYETLGFVNGAGTTIDRQSYEFSVEDLDFGEHTFRLKQIDLDGGYAYSNEVEVLIEVPDAVAIEGAYPNPFNPSTTLRFAVSVDQNVRVTLHDVQGRVLKEIGSIQAAPHEEQYVRIDGAGLPSGMYLVRLEGEFFAITEQVTLVR